MHQDIFQYSEDPIMQRVWKERIEPNLDQEQYTVNKINMNTFPIVKKMNINQRNDKIH